MRVVYAILLAAMIVGGFQPFFFRVLFADRAAAARELAAGPDRAFPGYAAFVRQARARIPPGARVAILVPMRRWDGGYAYAYYRASYILTSREVIPLVDPEDAAHLDRLARADYVAAWRMAPRLPHFAPAWSGDGGILLRRIE